MQTELERLADTEVLIQPKGMSGSWAVDSSACDRVRIPACSVFFSCAYKFSLFCVSRGGEDRELQFGLASLGQKPFVMQGGLWLGF